MREGWAHGTLADLVFPDVVKVDVRVGESYPIVGVLGFGRGLLYRDAVTADSTSYKQLHMIRPGQLIYSKLKAFEGAITVVPVPHAPSFASPEFPTYSCTDNALPSFVRLLTQMPALWEAMAAQSKGLGGRRERLNPADLLSVRVVVPPLVEQRRIVDLIESLDETIAHLSEAARQAREAKGFLLEGLLSRLPDETPEEPLGDHGEFIRGRRFVKSDYVDDGLGCIHYGQIHTHFGSVATEVLTHIPESMRGRMRLARPGDVVVAATSEDVSDLGKATAWLGSEEVAVHDDCQIFRHRLDPRFASHLFASAGVQRQKAQFAAGMKVMRISGADLARIVVPVPDRSTQEALGRAMSDLDSAYDAMMENRSNLRALRSNLLTALLSGEHEIPATYDELMVGEA